MDNFTSCEWVHHMHVVCVKSSLYWIFPAKAWLKQDMYVFPGSRLPSWFSYGFQLKRTFYKSSVFIELKFNTSHPYTIEVLCVTSVRHNKWLMRVIHFFPPFFSSSNLLTTVVHSFLIKISTGIILWLR